MARKAEGDCLRFYLKRQREGLSEEEKARARRERGQTLRDLMREREEDREMGGGDVLYDVRE